MAYTKLELQLVEALRDTLRELKESRIALVWNTTRDRIIIRSERVLAEAEKWA